MSQLQNDTGCDSESSGASGGAGGDTRRFFGKYRGKVENNVDPMMQGRVQVSCPAVLGNGRFAWAMPCVPYAGPGVGFFAVPPVFANVWVEFEGGDPDYPILGGCFWGLGEAPQPAASTPMGMTKVFQTESISLTLDDLPGIGGAFLEVNPPAVTIPFKMSFDMNGVEISGGPASVTITATSIEVKHTASTVTVSPTDIEIAATPATAKISPTGIEMSAAPSEIKLGPSGVEVKSAPAEATIGASGIELKNAASSLSLSAASADLKSAKVAINDGALEVV